MEKPPVIDAEQATDVPEPIRLQTKKGKMGPKEQQYMNLIRQLTDKAATLVVKVAVCDCKQRNECKVFKEAQSLASIIDQLQEVGKVGASRRGVRT
jgi:hypothetical protein